MAARHDIIKAAKKNTGRGPAYLVYDFNQRHTPQYKQTSKDFCAGLGLQWLALHLAGNDYPYDEKTEVLDDPGNDPMDVHNVYLSQGHGKAFEKVGLKEASSKKVSGAVQPGSLVSEAATPGMYFLQIRENASTGHAVAFRIYSWGTDERAVCYFDANLGSFYFGNRKEFQDWFDWVLGLPLLANNESYQSHYADHWRIFRLVKN